MGDWQPYESGAVIASEQCTDRFEMVSCLLLVRSSN